MALVHTALAGTIGRNPPDSSSATRAMFMIDPLADKPLPIGNVGKSLYSVVKNIVPTFIAESRYQTADMELFADDDVYSRYQLVPFRPPSADGPAKVGEPALAGTSLFAAAGWCCRAFRAHDFLLGRHNMQAYLQREFMLLADNPLFDGWTLDQRKDFARGENFERIDVEAGTPPKSYYLPILPDRTLRGPLPAAGMAEGAIQSGHADADAEDPAEGGDRQAGRRQPGPAPCPGCSRCSPSPAWSTPSPRASSATSGRTSPTPGCCSRSAHGPRLL